MTGETATTYVVQPGDTLWSIAAKLLGSPLRWRQIADMNIGKPQPGGVAMTDAGWIMPGWVLEIPNSVPPPAANSLPAASVPSLLAEPRDKRVEREAGLPSDEAVAVASASVAPTLDARLASDVVAGPLSLAPSGNGSKTGAMSASSAAKHHASRSEMPAPLLLGAIGAVGLVMLLERLRRVQTRWRAEGRLVRLPLGRAARMERMLRISADREGAAWVDLALALVAARSRAEGRECPSVAAARVDHEAVSLAVRPYLADPPFPFVPGSSPGWWRLERNLEVAEAAHEDPWVATVDCVAPALVSLGCDDDGGEILVDLESAGSIALAGEKGEHVLGAMVAQLASSPRGEHVEVVAVGPRSPDASGVASAIEGWWLEAGQMPARVRHVASLSEILPEIEGRSSQVAAMLEATGVSSVVAARSIGEAAAWDPTVVLCAREVADSEAEALLRAIRIAGAGERAVAVVCVADDPGARLRIEVNDGTISLEECDLDLPSLALNSVGREEAEVMDALVASALDRNSLGIEDPPYDCLEIPLPALPDEVDGVGACPSVALPAPVDQAADAVVDAIADAIVAEPTEGTCGEVPLAMNASVGGDERESQAAGAEGGKEEGRVRVLVLGPVEVEGAERPFTRAWALELVVYLAMHPRGCTTEQWVSALWPDKLPAASTVHSVASTARRALGRAPDGSDHLPRQHGRLRLGPGVSTDWSSFALLASSGDPEDWKHALALVRGRPFDGLRASDWALFEGIQSAIEAGVVDLACRLSDHALAVGNADLAEWAARRGLLMSPYDERLYRQLMKAADLAGNPAGVEAVMSELVSLVAEEVEPLDSVHPETAALYRSLSRRPTLARR